MCVFKYKNHAFSFSLSHFLYLHISSIYRTYINKLLIFNKVTNNSNFLELFRTRHRKKSANIDTGIIFLNLVFFFVLFFFASVNAKLILNHTTHATSKQFRDFVQRWTSLININKFLFRVYISLEFCVLYLSAFKYKLSVISGFAVLFHY